MRDCREYDRCNGQSLVLVMNAATEEVKVTTLQVRSWTFPTVSQVTDERLC